MKPLSPNQHAWLAVLAPAGLGLGMRLKDLSAHSFWADEFHVALGPPGDVLRAVQTAASDVYPPLHYVLSALIGWPLGVRALSAVAGAISVGLAALVAGRWSGPRGAWLAGLWLATLPAHVYFSQEARAYTFVGLLCAALSAGLAWRTHPVVIGWLAAAIMYTHGLGPAYLAGLAIAAVLLDRRDAVLGIVAGAATFAPWFLHSVQQGSRFAGWHTEPPTAAILLHVLRHLGVGHSDSVWAALGAIPALVALGLAGGDRRTRAFAAAVAITAAMILSLELLLHGIMAKYLVPMLPLVAVVIGATATRNRRWWPLASGIVLAPGVLGLYLGNHKLPARFNLACVVEATMIARSAGPIAATVPTQWHYFALDEWIPPLPSDLDGLAGYNSWQKQAFTGRSDIVWWWLVKDAAGPKRLDERFPVVWSVDCGEARGYALAVEPGEPVLLADDLRGPVLEEHGRLAFYGPASVDVIAPVDGALILWATGSLLGAERPEIVVRSSEEGAAHYAAEPRLTRLSAGPVRAGEVVTLAFERDASGPDGDLNVWLHRVEVVPERLHSSSRR